MSSPQLQPKGTAFLYSFPFWMFVDTSKAPTIKSIKIDGSAVRIYPPFRSGKANFIPMPPIDPYKIPFVAGTEFNIAPDFVIPTMAIIPELGLDASGHAALKSVWGSDWGTLLQMMPMDSLRVDVLEVDVNKAQSISDRCVLQLIQLLRSQTRQWWIEQTVDAGFLRSSFAILEQGNPLEMPTFDGTGVTVFGDEQPIKEDIWQESINNLVGGVITPLYDLLVLDARYFAATSSIRRAVIDAAVACEQARDVHFERWWDLKVSGSPFKLGRVITGNNLPHHLNEDLLKMTNNAHSYKNEHPSYFALIEDLWDSRGNIAHGRPNQFHRAGTLHYVDREKALEFTKAAEHCVRWLESL